MSVIVPLKANVPRYASHRMSFKGTQYRVKNSLSSRPGHVAKILLLEKVVRMIAKEYWMKLRHPRLLSFVLVNLDDGDHHVQRLAGRQSANGEAAEAIGITTHLIVTSPNVGTS